MKQAHTQRTVSPVTYAGTWVLVRGSDMRQSSLVTCKTLSDHHAAQTRTCDWRKPLKGVGPPPPQLPPPLMTLSLGATGMLLPDPLKVEETVKFKCLFRILLTFS